MTLRAVFYAFFVLALSSTFFWVGHVWAGGDQDNHHASQFKNYAMFSYSEFERKIPGSRDATGDGLIATYGYQFNAHIDLEASIGDYDYDTVKLGGRDVDGVKAKTIEASALFKSHVSKTFTPFAMIGVIYVDRDIPTPYDDSSLEPYLGVGLDIRINERWDIRTSFKPVRGEVNADVYSIGPKYRF